MAFFPISGRNMLKGRAAAYGRCGAEEHPDGPGRRGRHRRHGDRRRHLQDALARRRPVRERRRGAAPLARGRRDLARRGPLLRGADLHLSPPGRRLPLPRALLRGRPAFLFAWSRITVIQTGSIALHAFILGDYASEVLRLGPYSSSVYAVAAVVILTAVNMTGIKQGNGRRTS